MAGGKKIREIYLVLVFQKTQDSQSYSHFEVSEERNCRIFKLEKQILIIKYEEHVCHYIIKICNYAWVAVKGLHVFNEVHIVHVQSNKNEKSYGSENLIYMIIHINLLGKKSRINYNSVPRG